MRIPKRVFLDPIFKEAEKKSILRIEDQKGKKDKDKAIAKIIQKTDRKGRNETFCV